MNKFINRDSVLAILNAYQHVDGSPMRKEILRLPWFPELKEVDGQNMLGQTEEEFWDLIDSQDK